MCKPTDEDPDRYYPARKMFTTALLTDLLLVPFALDPLSEASLFMARCFLPMYVTAYIPALFQRYYWPHLNSKLKKRFRIPFILIFYLIILSFLSYFDVHYPSWLVYFIAVHVLFGDILFYRFGKDFLRVLNEHNINEYATHEDFQFKYAMRVFTFSIFLLVVWWIPFVLGNAAVIAVSFICMAVINVILLLTFLHPHSVPNFNDEEESVGFDLSSKEKSLALQAEILSVIKEKKLFLDQHITLESLHSHLSCGRTYASKACKELGGFYNIINSMRLEYAKAYQKSHPDANQDEIAQESGFTCRQTMAHAKNRLNQI